MQLNPFGEAKPVDASARLRELEEKIAKQKASLSQHYKPVQDPQGHLADLALC